ncbi:hypothetical protein CDAR_32791 [Caerostris darwini]|uniref:Uncharacterized protein n=1 Tax=Caerostris darwini TaxID=1538125 RepID=A0AAV4SLS9_9ARAC|nr:hypothetical protein CDAR_32791 [Caerostris darwini]
MEKWIHFARDLPLGAVDCLQRTCPPTSPLTSSSNCASLQASSLNPIARDGSSRKGKKTKKPPKKMNPSVEDGVDQQSFGHIPKVLTILPAC